MIVTKKALPRRTVLRGLGVSLALPFLDGMVPAFANARHTAAAAPRRFVAVYAGNGMSMGDWTPAKEGALEFGPIMRSLEPLKSHTAVLSHLNSNPVNLVQDGGIHPRCQTAWLTGTCAKKADYDLEAGTSLDQIVAQHLGQQTQLSSLELCMESPEGIVGNCAFGYGCAYNNTVSWKDPHTPLPMETNPRVVFERMFGATDSTERGVRLAQLQKNRSILDSVLESVGTLEPKMGADDRRRLAQYLDAIRDVERRIEVAEQQVGLELPVIDQPVGIPQSFEEHAKLQFDLMALALQADLTRVATFIIARETSNLPYPQIGVPDAHHALSHHGNNPDKIARLAKLNGFHFQQFAYFAEKLKASADGESTLLDNTLALYGGGIGNSNQHDPLDLPTVLVGGQGMGVPGGVHVKYDKGTHLTNLYLTILDKLGIDVEKFGDSNGKVELLSGV